MCAWGAWQRWAWVDGTHTLVSWASGGAIEAADAEQRLQVLFRVVTALKEASGRPGRPRWCQGATQPLGRPVLQDSVGAPFGQVATVVEVATRFRLLLDSNVLFAAEPFAGRLEPGFSPVAELLRIASEQGHAVLIHPASLDDAREDKDLERRRQRLAELGKYACLRETPILPKLAELFGSLRPGSNDARDLRILSALPARAATHLVTDDNRLRRRAARAGFGAAVSTVGDTLALLRDLVRPAAEPPPRVRELLAYEVDGGQSIFASLRLDYPEGNGQVGFDTWLDKVRADPANRKIFAVIIDGAYQAVAILKLEEDDRRYGFPAGTTKIATLKVHDDHGGSKLGELLLKAVLSDAHERGEVPRVSRTVDTITPLRW